jgi:hypothetical protein
MSWRNVRFWPKADILSCTAHVRFRGKSGQGLLRCACRLLTQSGHWPCLQSLFEPLQSRVPSLGAAMRRREFITMIGGVAAWPFAARAQRPVLPVVGFVSVASARGGYAPHLSAFLEGAERSRLR